MDELKDTKVLMIIAHFEFRDEEYETPRRIFEEAGINVTVASTSTHLANGLLGLQVKPDIVLEQVHVRDYDAIIFIGGPGVRDYFTDGSALRITREAFDNRILIGAICSAPTILANANIIAGRKVTAFKSEQETIEGSGGYYTGRLVEQDGEIITGSDPESSEEFGEAIVKALKWRKGRKGYLI